MPETPQVRDVAHEHKKRFGQSVWIPWRHEQPTNAIFYRFRNAADVRCHCRQSAGHRLEYRQRKTLVEAWQNIDIGCRKPFGDIFLIAYQPDAMCEAEALAQGPQFWLSFAFSQTDQL